MSDPRVSLIVGLLAGLSVGLLLGMLLCVAIVGHLRQGSVLIIKREENESSKGA